MDSFKNFINKIILRSTGYQLARPGQLLAFDGADRRKLINEWIAGSNPTGKILDLGAGPTSFAKEHFDTVITFDQFAAPGVDVVGDVHTVSSSFKTEEFDTIVCVEIFEHTKDPLRAIGEIYKILKPGGLFIASAPLTHELHGEDYGDYWRITPQGWKLILADFKDIEISTRGVYPQISHVFVRATK